MKSKFIKTVKEYGIIAAGVLIAALGISQFLAPHNIVSGGVSGLAIVINEITGFPIGVSVLLMNIPLFIAGVFFLGKSFGIKSLYGAFLFSLFLDATATDFILTDDLLMSAVFGGALIGIGFGFIFLTGATSGGTDILAALFHNFIPFIDIGKWFFIIDIVIISIGTIFFQNTDLLLAGIIALALNSFVLDYIILGANTAKLVYIISDRSAKISEEIIKNVNRGVTGISVRGMYTGDERNMLMCVVKRFEIRKLEQIVEKIDKKAFIIFSQARKITGQGFISYPVKNKKSKN